MSQRGFCSECLTDNVIVVQVLRHVSALQEYLPLPVGVDCGCYAKMRAALAVREPNRAARWPDPGSLADSPTVGAQGAGVC